jgi:polar amino acid transport system substrate-binding protein
MFATDNARIVRRAAALLGVTVVAIAVAACSSSKGNQARSVSSIKEMTTCGDFTDPPFNYVDGTAQKGFDPDFLRAATSSMNVSLTMKDTRFSSLIAGLKAGRCDAVVSFMYITPERGKVVDFVPYAESGLGFLVREGGSYRPQVLSDLCGHSVSTLQGGVEDSLALSDGTLGKQCAKQGKPISVRSLPTDAAAVQDLIAGRVDAFFMDHAGAVAFAKQYASHNLVVSNRTLLNPVVGGIAVRKNDSARKQWFEKAIINLNSSGALAQLYQHYGLGRVSTADFNNALAGKPVGTAGS